MGRNEGVRLETETPPDRRNGVRQGSCWGRDVTPARRQRKVGKAGCFAGQDDMSGVSGKSLKPGACSRARKAEPADAGKAGRWNRRTGETGRTAGGTDLEDQGGTPERWHSAGKRE